jgi:serine/threonine protein kinase
MAQARQEYPCDSDRDRATSLNRTSETDGAQVVEDQVVLPRIEVVNGSRYVTVDAVSKDQRHVSSLTFEECSVLGEGSFGRVYLAVIKDTNNLIAIKTVLQDKRFKNRELQFIRSITHPNVIDLKHYFYTKQDHERVAQNGNAYLSLVMEYIPDTLYTFIQRFAKMGRRVPTIYIKAAMYQVFRGLAYIHSMVICHRDIKPHNILINEQTGVVKICDLGSMKKLEDGTPSVSYICSRYFRAPELLMGCEVYSCAIDIWSAACTLAEMFLQHPLFPGHHTQDQLAKIMRILGSPNTTQLKALASENKRPEILLQELPYCPPKKLFEVLPESAPIEASTLLTRMLDYVPSKRITLANAMKHMFFDELRNPETTLPNGMPLPPIANFTNAELAYLEPAQTQPQPKRHSFL